MRVTWLALEWPRSNHHSGGVGRYAARLAERTAKLVELTVVTYEGATPIPGIRYKFIPAPKGRIERYYASAWHARNAVAASRPDVIHAHGDDFLLRADAPIVRTFYGLSLSEARSSTGLRKYNHYLLALLEDLSAKRATARLGIAPEAVDHFNCEDLFPPFLGIAQISSRQPSPVPTVVFIGSYHGRKQGRLAQQAVERLRSNGFADTRLVVIGPKDDARNWASWVEHCSGLNDQQVSESLASAWVLVSPSSYEGFGIPIVEGLAHEVAVIALANPGSTYIRSQADTSVPLIITDPGGFIDAVLTRMKSGPLLSDSESASAKNVVAKLTHAGSPERLVEIYRDVLEAK